MFKKTRKIWNWHGASLVTKNVLKNRNPNNSITPKSTKIVACCQIYKIYFCMPLIIILVIVSYFVYVPFINVLMLFTTVILKKYCLLKNRHNFYFIC